MIHKASNLSSVLISHYFKFGKLIKIFDYVYFMFYSGDFLARLWASAAELEIPQLQ